MKNLKGPVLVVIQLISISILIFTTHWLKISVWALLLIVLSGILMFWAVITMKVGNFNVVPTPVKGGSLTINGPYRFIRHPMYSSLLLSGLAMILGQFSIVRLVIVLIFLADILLKIRYEEHLLEKEHPDYPEYSKGTKRIIPFLW
jgi:protein-S-isoprenylcysteine O-methyltransferase Ste14